MNSQTLRRVIFAGLFLIPFVPFLVSSSLFFPFITTKAFAFRIIIEIVFGAWLILAITTPEYRPKRSPILIAVGAFLLIVGLANLFGMEPVKSFWSNYERMEGFVAMLHLGAMFLVMSSVLNSRSWGWWWNTTLTASALMVIYSIFQLLGALEIHQGGVRVDGTLGNAAYLALYMLIHIFVAIYFFAKSKVSGLRWIYALLIFGQTAILYFTATRGAILGLLGGLFIVALLNITNKEDLQIRKWSRSLLAGLLILVVGFMFVRNTAFVQSSQTLNRFANLNVLSLKTEGRAFIWPMAVEGIKERPFLGWGQENFNYVFAEHYQAEMFRLEPWFDRAHNIFLDWGISAGLLGLGAYLSLYIFFLSALWRRTALSRVEKSVLTGLISAYFFNNFFVFDNLISYTLFFSLLAYVHSRSNSGAATTFPAHGQASGNSREMSLPLLGGVIVLLLGAVYFINIKPIVANTSLIRALQATQTESAPKDIAMEAFRQAYESSRLGRPEVVEWISSSAPTLLADERVPMEVRNEYFLFARDAVVKQSEEFEGDPRYEMIAGNMFLATGFLDEALVHLDEARRLIPEKQAILWNIGQVLYYKQDFAGALEIFREAYELAPEYDQAREIYEAAQRELSN